MKQIRKQIFCDERQHPHAYRGDAKTGCIGNQGSGAASLFARVSVAIAAPLMRREFQVEAAPLNDHHGHDVGAHMLEVK